MFTMRSKRSFYPVLLAATLVLESAQAQSLPIQIFQAKKFSSAPVPASRTPLGIPEDYKPWIAKLKNDQLLIVCFHAGRNPM